MYKALIMIRIFQGWRGKIPGSYRIVAGFLIRVNIHRVYCVKQGVYWHVCRRCVYGILQLRQDSFYFSSNVSTDSTYTGRIKGYTERGVDAMCTDLVYFMDNDPWFLATMKLVFGISSISGRVYGYS